MYQSQAGTLVADKVPDLSQAIKKISYKRILPENEISTQVEKSNKDGKIDSDELGLLARNYVFYRKTQDGPSTVPYENLERAIFNNIAQLGQSSADASSVAKTVNYYFEKAGEKNQSLAPETIENLAQSILDAELGDAVMAELNPMKQGWLPVGPMDKAQKYKQEFSSLLEQALKRRKTH